MTEDLMGRLTSTVTAYNLAVRDVVDGEAAYEEAREVFGAVAAKWEEAKKNKEVLKAKCLSLVEQVGHAGVGE